MQRQAYNVIETAADRSVATNESYVVHHRRRRARTIVYFSISQRNFRSHNYTYVTECQETIKAIYIREAQTANT